MIRQLYSEMRTVYETSVENPHTFRLTIKMKDMIDGDILEQAVRKTIKRYPYFCMRLHIGETEISFADNEQQMPVLHSDGPITLGGDEVNGHLLAFSWWKNKIHIDVYHALTDGGGIYHLVKTLLYYYCSYYYKTDLSTENIRLAGDPVDEREWEDPALKPVESQPFAPSRNGAATAFS